MLAGCRYQVKALQAQVQGDIMAQALASTTQVMVVVPLRILGGGIHSQGGVQMIEMIGLMGDLREGIQRGIVGIETRTGMKDIAILPPSQVRGIDLGTTIEEGGPRGAK